MNRFRLICLLLFASAATALAQPKHELSGDKLPWTSTPNVKSEKFRFIVLPDRTGGEMRGVFDNTIDLLNGLNADFMITIGDMIDGYTENTEYADSMWESYFKSTSSLKAPLVFTPGNHDVSNKMLDEQWRQRFGYSYYYFVLGNNLFLVLNSEENAGSITATQTDYCLDILSRFGQERNVYVFMHRPLWSTDKSGGYARIHEQLTRYNAVVFCGHEHRYLKTMRDSIAHYMVATLGGGSEMRGMALGEFNHFMIVDADRDKVQITNMLNDGTVIPDDIVNEDNLKAVDALRLGSWLKCVPIVANQRILKDEECTLVLTNDIDTPLNVRGALAKGDGYRFSQDSICVQVAPLSSDSIKLRLVSSQGLDVEALNGLAITINGDYRVNDHDVKADNSQKIVLDYLRRLSSESMTIQCKSPGYIKEDWDWKGAQDGYFDIMLRRSGNKIDIEVTTYDDKLITDSDFGKLQDKIYICFSSDVQQETEGLIFTAGNCNKQNGKCISSGNSLKASASFDIKDNAQSIRLNVGFMDHDNPLNTKPSVLWWKPLWGTAADYSRSGEFILGN